MTTLAGQTGLALAWEQAAKPALKATGIDPGAGGDAAAYCAIALVADPALVSCAAGAGGALGQAARRPPGTGTTDPDAPFTRAARPRVGSPSRLLTVAGDAVGSLFGAAADTVGLVQDDAQLGKGGLVLPGSRLGGLLPGTPARRRQVVQDLSDAGGRDRGRLRAVQPDPDRHHRP